MKKGLTDITFLLDRSGSMANHASDTIGGFNTFLKEQQDLEGEANFTLIQFAGVGESVLHATVSIKDQVRLDTTNYRATGGSTAYLDALGRAINETGKRLHSLRESHKPAKVVFVVMTDGLENASREFTKAGIKAMIEHQENVYNWQFVFMEGANIGVSAMRAYSYNTNSVGFAEAYVATSKNLRNYRSNLVTNMDFTEEDRKKQEQAK
jgi:hypothetical protein